MTSCDPTGKARVVGEQGAAEAGFLPDQVDRALGPYPLNRGERAEDEKARKQRTAKARPAAQLRLVEVGGGVGTAESLGHHRNGLSEKKFFKMKSLAFFIKNDAGLLRAEVSLSHQPYRRRVGVVPPTSAQGHHKRCCSSGGGPSACRSRAKSGLVPSALPV